MKKSRLLSAAALGLSIAMLGSLPAIASTDINITWEDMFGAQDGVLTVDTEASEWSLYFANPYGEHTVSGVYAEDGKMECTNDNGEGQFLPMDAIAQVAEPAIAELINGGASSVIDVDITWEDMFGPQDAVLTVDKAAGEWSLFFENPYGEHTVSGVFDENGKMECTNDNGEGQFLPMDTIAAVAEPVIAAILNGETAPTSDSEGESAGDSAETAADDFENFTDIVTFDALDFPTVFEKLPDAYNTYDAEHKGSQIYIDYTTDVYEDGVTYDKFARVYLPYGYNPEDTETKYNVIYLQHGNSNTPSTFFDVVIPKANFVNLMDNLFDPEHGLMEPCIVVCPTYYLGIEKDTVGVLDDQAIAGDGRYEGLPGNYYKEVIEDLIPAVESQLNVYCDDFTPEGIEATRDHRAWAGFSRGSVCTWYMFHNAFEYFRYWMPTSAGCMPENKVLGMGEWSNEDCYQYLKEPIDANPELPFYIIAQAGGLDVDGPAASMTDMAKYLMDQDVFSYGLNPEKNNFYYTLSDFTHDQLLMPYYFYTAKDILFKYEEVKSDFKGTEGEN